MTIPRCVLPLLAAWGLLMVSGPAAQARITLAALPERGATVIRLDNPEATLIEEDRVLTLQQGSNHVDFSWKGVRIDEDSIRLNLLTQPGEATLLSVSYPPGESALVWEIHSRSAMDATVRISYLLSHIDRLIAYKGVSGSDETVLDFKKLLVLRNFSGEDFDAASVVLGEGTPFEQPIAHGETTRRMLSHHTGVPLKKIWKFDTDSMPWDPAALDAAVGIPVYYRIENVRERGFGTASFPAGKARLFQEDGTGGTIFLGEDTTGVIPVGEPMELYVGDSRDIVVTQHMMSAERTNVRRDNKNRVVLYDSDEVIKAAIRNFKDRPAVLTLLEHIPGQWDMIECSMDYTRKDASTLEFEVSLSAGDVRELLMHYRRRNVR